MDKKITTILSFISAIIALCSLLWGTGLLRGCSKPKEHEGDVNVATQPEDVNIDNSDDILAEQEAEQAAILAEQEVERAAILAEQAKEQDLANAKQMVDTGNYADAIRLLSSYSDSEIVTICNSYKSTFERQVLTEAEKKVFDKDYDGAISLLKNAQALLSDSDAIADLLADVISKKPVPISALVLIDSEKWSINEGEPIDIFRNTHYSDYTCVLYNSNAMFGTTGTSNYAEYRSYKEYSKLTGTISPYQYIEGAIFRIILDDQQVISYEIGKKTDPIEFEIDISNADYIRFDVGLSYRSGIILSDVLLWKE